MNKIGFLTILLIFFTAFTVPAQSNFGISSAVEWDTHSLRASISLDLVSAGIRLPSGRTHGEALLSSDYVNLIRADILNLQVDSSSTIGDLLNRGELSMPETERFALSAHNIPPALSPDMRRLISSHIVSLDTISAALLRHSRPAPIMRTLTPVSAAQYTGIIIIAADNLPVHGMRSSALAVPCLFPKIWDTNMDIIFERNMLDTQNKIMVRYAPPHSIFQNNPSGLTAELTAHVGERPLRIFARGVFGINPTDLIIDHDDAMLIISSEANRRLLSQGKVAIILNDSVLRNEFTR